MPDDSFAAAQGRIRARQSLRQNHAAALPTESAAGLLETSLSRLPAPLNHTAVPLSSFLSTITSPDGTKPAFRVGQVDAELLDEELLALLRAQVGDAFKYLGAHLQDDWSAEIILFLRAVLFKLSIWDHDASYGASLQNLRYSDARKGAGLPRPTRLQKSLYGLITVFGKYGWDKWENWLIDQEGGYTSPSALVQRLSQMTRRVSTTYSAAALASFVVFLVNGRYRTLTDRLLRLRLVSPDSHINREVSFEYLNRQLVWHAFTEFLLFLLPLVGISRWRRWLSRAWRRTKAAFQDHGGESEAKAGPLSFLPERTCAICYQDQIPASTTEGEVLGANIGAGGGVIGSTATDIVNAYETIPCSCIYCFVCLSSKIDAEEGSGWPCLRCGEIVYKCKPWNGDIIVMERKSKSTGKNVGFVVEERQEVESREYDEHVHSSELGSSQWVVQEPIDDDRHAAQ